MKKTLLSIFLFSIGLPGFCTVWTITTGNSIFIPSTLNINAGDTVNVVATTLMHDAREVSLATWNANGTTALAGGFQTPFGGGMILPAQLTVGTHYYVCSAHASMGMKGTITVVDTTATNIVEKQPEDLISFYPNPSTGNIQLTIDDFQRGQNYTLEMYNVQGKKVYETGVIQAVTKVDISTQANGVYFIKVYNNGEAIRTEKIIIQ